MDITNNTGFLLTAEHVERLTKAIKEHAENRWGHAGFSRIRKVFIGESMGEYQVCLDGHHNACLGVLPLTDIFPGAYPSFSGTRLYQQPPMVCCRQCGKPVPPGKRLRVSLDILEETNANPNAAKWGQVEKEILLCNYRCLVALILPSDI